jgi:hypothetical protein
VIDIINGVFGSYYDVLVIALIVLVPVWVGRFLFESAGTLLARHRQRRG